MHTLRHSNGQPAGGLLLVTLRIKVGRIRAESGCGSAEGPDIASVVTALAATPIAGTMARAPICSARARSGTVLLHLSENAARHRHHCASGSGMFPREGLGQSVPAFRATRGRESRTRARRHVGMRLRVCAGAGLDSALSGDGCPRSWSIHPGRLGHVLQGSGQPVSGE